MKQIQRFRLKNPYFFLTTGMLLIALFMSWGIGSGFLDVILVSEEEVIKNMSYNSKQEYLDIILPNILTWEGAWLGAFLYISEVFPIFPSMMALGFIRELKGYFSLASHRFHKPKKSVRKACFWYAVQGGLAVTIALLIFNTILAPFVEVTFVDMGGIDDFFFPKYFYPLHPYCMFNVLACTIYFLVGFTFSLLAICIAMWKQNILWILATPFVVYKLENMLSSGLGGFRPLWVGDSVLAFQSSANLLVVSIPLWILIGVSICLIEWRLHTKKSWVCESGI